jgi:hypothetical protein
MGFTTVAVIAGLVIGLAAGGRIRNLGSQRFRWWLLLPLGAVLQTVPELWEVPAALAMVLASYAALAAFAMANLHLVGMSVVMVGLALNVAPIVANGGMPVRAEAIVAAGISEPHDVEHLRFGAKRHLERPDDRLTFLGDVIPVPPLREVLSFGDLVLAFGVADVLARMLRPLHRRP